MLPQLPGLGDVPAIVHRVVLGHDQVVKDAFRRPLDHPPVDGVVTGTPGQIVIQNRGWNGGAQPCGLLTFGCRGHGHSLTVFQHRKAEQLRPIGRPIGFLFLGVVAAIDAHQHVKGEDA